MFLKNSLKLLGSPLSVILQKFFTWRALKGHLSTQRVSREALQRDLGTLRALQGLGTQDIWGLERLRHSGTWALEAPEAVVKEQRYQKNERD